MADALPSTDRGVRLFNSMLHRHLLGKDSRLRLTNDLAARSMADALFAKHEEKLGLFGH
jgi:hypothetical protein